MRGCSRFITAEHVYAVQFSESNLYSMHSGTCIVAIKVKVMLYLPNKNKRGEIHQLGMEGLYNKYRSDGDINCCARNIHDCSSGKQKLTQTFVNNFVLLKTW